MHVSNARTRFIVIMIGIMTAAPRIRPFFAPRSGSGQPSVDIVFGAGLRLRDCSLLPIADPPQPGIDLVTDAPVAPRTSLVSQLSAETILSST